ncbi:MAG: PD-(D/E)XK nuclease family transposase, partial [Treponema sp.]|nr:PD-(D/E)XK nuclease family transposase [Treponema sp.]
EYANIEIQGVNTENNFEKRAEYYCAHLLNHNVQRGHKWHEIPKVYQISVLKFVCEKKSQKELLHYKFRTEEGFTLHDRQNIYFLELPKVEKLVQQIMTGKISVESLTDAQKWSIFILYASREEFKSLINEISHSQEGIMCAVTILKNISQDELMWKRQFDELILENDRLTFEHFATERGMKKGMEEGMKQGVKQGMEEGMKQGIEKGMKQGIEEGIKQKSIEAAKEGLKMNLTIIQIAKLTGLSEEKILELKQELDTQ